VPLTFQGIFDKKLLIFWSQFSKLNAKIGKITKKMATIRFIREDLEVQCNPGENLRELVIKENLQLYGLKGILGNCGGAGQCSTCFISVEGGNKNSLSPLTSVEEAKLKNRPENWRLACQTLVKSSSVILTKPQSPPSNIEELKKISENKKLPR